MEKYQNKSGKSTIVSYEIGDNYMIVKFAPSSEYTHTTYKYTYGSASADDVEKMKEFARDGWGLRSFINTHVKKLYEEKIK